MQNLPSISHTFYGIIRRWYIILIITLLFAAAGLAMTKRSSANASLPIDMTEQDFERAVNTLAKDKPEAATLKQLLLNQQTHLNETKFSRDSSILLSWPETQQLAYFTIKAKDGNSVNLEYLQGLYAADIRTTQNPLLATLAEQLTPSLNSNDYPHMIRIESDSNDPKAVRIGFINPDTTMASKGAEVLRTFLQKRNSINFTSLITTTFEFSPVKLEAGKWFDVANYRTDLDAKIAYMTNYGKILHDNLAKLIETNTKLTLTPSPLTREKAIALMGMLGLFLSVIGLALIQLWHNKFTYGYQASRFSHASFIGTAIAPDAKLSTLKAKQISASDAKPLETTQLIAQINQIAYAAEKSSAKCLIDLSLLSESAKAHLGELLSDTDCKNTTQFSVDPFATKENKLADYSKAFILFPANELNLNTVERHLDKYNLIGTEAVYFSLIYA